MRTGPSTPLLRLTNSSGSRSTPWSCLFLCSSSPSFSFLVPSRPSSFLPLLLSLTSPSITTTERERECVKSSSPRLNTSVLFSSGRATYLGQCSPSR
ncbi:hypothetical protein BDV33DRAFT_39318 [Aspergillus novoparasiticus]|uniref:Uncharacterized protein n=1 Tax=Aspergillus novoparasiticus TaxID=986946 RepID=A0A5N6F267_9EURO|nr:hypothetical protein BDV33DRAFT_39318 [Aspergillus novoparasiticus]